MQNQLLILIHSRLRIPILIRLIILGLMLAAGLVLAAPALAQGPPPDSACKGCHVGNTEALTLPSGESIPLGVDAEALTHSVHGAQTAEAVYCTDCHRNQTRYLYPHQPNPAQTRQEFAADVAQNCSTCHSPIQKHNPGHLQAADNLNLPGCADCHGGGHAIESVEAFKANPVAACQSCHESFEDAKIGAVHEELAANLGPGQTCRNCHTDKPAYPADQPCRACHSLLKSEMTLASGEKVPLHVDAIVIENSVHGLHQIDEHQYTPLLCTDCHTNQARYGFPHEPVTPPDARRFTLEMSNLCEQCHEDIFKRQQDSTHAAALAEGKLEAAMCSDCHGSHNVQVPNEPRERISKTCAQCHATINQEYAASVHGAALLGEHNPDVPVCIDCHGVHDISAPRTALFRVRSPRLCGECHADEKLMAKYDISTDVFNTYVADFHGTTVELFDKQSPDHETNKAVCYDCHGVHNILPATDANSQVIKDNLLVTCQKCHPDATANFSDAWTSHFEPSLEHNPLIYLVNLFYRILIPATVGGFLLFIASDAYRRYLAPRLKK